MSNRERRKLEVLVAILTTVIVAGLLLKFSSAKREIVTIKSPAPPPIIVAVAEDALENNEIKAEQTTLGQHLEEEYNKPSQFLIDVYQKQAEKRRERLKEIKKAADNDWGFAYLYNNMAPEVYCSEKLKVGTTDDGGKWMCSPQKLPDGCVIFALGLAGVITFEEDIQMYSKQRCRIISADWIKQKPEVISAIEAIGGIVIEARIGPENNGTTRTMESILKENGAEEIEILKMDIEGAELKTMEAFLGSYTPAQLMVEVHGPPTQVIDFLQMVASKGYYLIHYEINGRWHILAEYAFIHESKLKQYGATVLASFLSPK